MSRLASTRDEVVNRLVQIDQLLLQMVREQDYCTLHKIDSTGNYLNNDIDKDNEKNLLEQLAKLRADLKIKKDVQDSFLLEGDPVTMLEKVS